MPIREDFASRIERLRILSGLKKRELDRLAGLPEGHVRIVVARASKHVSALLIADVADVFGVTSDYLFRGVGSCPPREEILVAVERAKARAARKTKPKAA